MYEQQVVTIKMNGDCKMNFKHLEATLFNNSGGRFVLSISDEDCYSDILDSENNTIIARIDEKNYRQIKTDHLGFFNLTDEMKDILLDTCDPYLKTKIEFRNREDKYYRLLLTLPAVVNNKRVCYYLNNYDGGIRPVYSFEKIESLDSILLFSEDRVNGFDITGFKKEEVKNKTK